MILELKVPHAATFAASRRCSRLLSYVLSFVYVDIYWNNHHQLLAAARHVSGGSLWAKVHLLFWLSLFPFATAWMGENHFAEAPVAAYGVVLLIAAIAYWLLQQRLIAAEGVDCPLRTRSAATGRASCRRWPTSRASSQADGSHGFRRRCTPPSRWFG